MLRRKKNFSIESLERRECLTATVVEVEPNNNEFQGTQFELDPTDNSAELLGTSVNDDDDDWFRFVVPVDGFLVGTVNSPNGNFAELDVERINGLQVLETDPDQGINTSSGAVTAGEELFVRMRSDNGAAAEYSTLLNITDTDPGGNNNGGGPGPTGDPTAFYPEVEDNDRKIRATPFDLIQDGVVQLQGTSQNDDDKDFFSFTMPSDGDVVFEIFSPNGELADLEIETRFEDEIIEVEPTDTGFTTGTVTLAAGETYFLRMRADDAAAAQYEVNIGLTEATGAPIGASTFVTPNTSGSASDPIGNSDPGESPVTSSQKTDYPGRVALRPTESALSEYATRRDRYEATDLALAEYDALFGE